MSDTRATRPSSPGYRRRTSSRKLLYEPTRETRNRKPLRPNPVAQYRLRLESLRVYYDVDEGPARIVLVRGVGIKIRQRILIGGKEVVL